MITNITLAFNNKDFITINFWDQVSLSWYVDGLLNSEIHCKRIRFL